MTRSDSPNQQAEDAAPAKKFSDPYLEALKAKYGLAGRQVHVVSSYQLPDGRLLIRLGPECHVILKAGGRGADRQKWFGKIRNPKLVARLYGSQEGGPWRGPQGERDEATRPESDDAC